MKKIIFLVSILLSFSSFAESTKEHTYTCISDSSGQTITGIPFSELINDMSFIYINIDDSKTIVVPVHNCTKE